MKLDEEYLLISNKRSENIIRRRFKTLLGECLTKHEYKYTYDKVVYSGMAKKVIITCPVHGDFEQSLDQHLKAGYGCRKCADENNKVIISSEKFIQDSQNIHGDKYNYDMITGEIQKTSKQYIICSSHGKWSTTYYNHVITGSGCRKCAAEYHDIDFRKRFFDKPTVLYYVNITSEAGIFWKIGITNRFDDNDVNKRFKSEKVQIQTLYMKYFINGAYAYEEEQRLLNKYKKYIINQNTVVLKNGGNSEVLSVDCWNYNEGDE